ncbi:hypothetical protein HYS00_03770 [Candidatus Microgenomates bacterium]|nr:hypothetical protein [Candidatus Microgenomates bacterium]
MLENVKKWYRSLPDKKVYFELLGAVLTIPVLITVILLNLNNLHGGNGKNNPIPTPQIIKVVETVAPSQNGAVTSTQTSLGGAQRVSPQASCKKQIGPVNISSPQEGQVISSGPVCVTISYNTGEYCGIQWAVRIDGSSYSDFSDKDICYSNLPNGNHSVNVKIRSAVDSTQELILLRSFQYTGGTSAPTPATTSAALSQ